MILSIFTGTALDSFPVSSLMAIKVNPRLSACGELVGLVLGVSKSGMAMVCCAECGGLFSLTYFGPPSPLKR